MSIYLDIVYFYCCFFFFFYFFMQAEDGIRDPLVTVVQTCALPICWRRIGCRAPLLYCGLARRNSRAAANASPTTRCRARPVPTMRKVQARPPMTGRQSCRQNGRASVRERDDNTVVSRT